jgi:EAL domain-containing protein (putative c-di-GMP-specific phosphodiesterase class I)/GGDEF domain-containing protein
MVRMQGDTTAEEVRRLLEFVERTADLVGMLDADGRVIYMNQAARKHLGFADPTGLTAANFFSADLLERYYNEIRSKLLRRGSWSGEVAIQTQAGDALPIWCELIADVGPGGEIRGMVTHGKPLHSDEAEPHTSRRDQRVGIVEVTLHDLHEARRTFPSFIADGVRRAAARRLTQAVRSSDAVVQVGDITFVVVFDGVRDVAELMRHAQTLKEVCDREPIVTAAGEVVLNVTIRTALGEPGDAYQHVLARIDTSPGDAIWDSQGGDDHNENDGSTGEALRLAVMRGEIRTHVSPVVDRRGNLAGYEARAQWSHPPIGVLEGKPLYALADRVPGVRSAMDLRVLREVTAVVATSSGNEPLRIYAPASRALLDDVYLEQHIWELADATGLSAGQIHVSVDYETIEDRHRRIRDVLRSIQDNGYALVVAGIHDEVDLETLIRDYSPTEIRLSETMFEYPLGEDKRRRIQHCVEAAHERDVCVIASRIDSEAERALATDFDIDYATGAVYGRSTPTDEIV